MIWQLFLSFSRIGLFTFGGGYAMIPVIRHEVCERRGWIAQEDFLETLTLAQSAPGPISLNTAVFVGYKMCGVWGAIVSLAGVVLPSFAVILAVALFFSEIRENALVDAAFRAMRPAVVALIIAPIVALARGVRWWLIGISAITALIIWGTGISPIIILLVGAIGGLLWAVYVTRKEGGR